MMGIDAERWIQLATAEQKARLIARFRAELDANMADHQPTGASLSALALFQKAGWPQEEQDAFFSELVARHDWPFAILMREHREMGDDEKTGVLFTFPEGWTDGRRDRAKYFILAAWGLRDEH